MFDADASLLPPGARVLAAVSGGADSVALLVWLRDLGREVVVGHVNHALDELRGGACARDEAWLRAQCARWSVAFAHETIELPRKGGHVDEAVARAGRYGALERLARANNCLLVATAHTASDALEGLMLNVGRGAGVRGQSGFAPSRALGEGLRLVRPLWRVGREEVRAWLAAREQSWLEDESNSSVLFRRNRVRAEVVPLLSEIFGRPADELARGYAVNAALAREEDTYMEGAARAALKELVVKRAQGLLSLDGLRFRQLDAPIGRRVLLLGAREVLPEARGIEARKVETVLTVVATDGKRAVWTWRNELRVEWTGAFAGNRLRFWRV